MPCACGIVVSEVLCFLQQKYNTLDEISLMQLCENSFSERIIEEAKDVLLSCCPEINCPTLRKGDGKKKRNLQDILKILREKDPSDLPKFAAINLSSLPPVTFDYIDVTSLLKDLTALKFEVHKLKTFQVNSEVGLKADIETLKTDLDKLKSNNDRRESGTCVEVGSLTSTAPSVCATAAGGVDIPPPPLPVQKKRLIKDRAPLRAAEDSQVALTSKPTILPIDPPTRSNGPSVLLTRLNSNLLPATSRSNSIAEIEKLPADNDSSSGRTNKKRVIVGSGTNLSGTLRASQSYRYFCVSRINISSSAEDVKRHLCANGFDNCLVFLCKTRSGEFNSFKLGVPTVDIEKVFNPDLWPTGVIVKEWTVYSRKPNA